MASGKNLKKTHLLEKHDHETLNFPEGFLWGAATSAHQVEGNNIYNDWWQWEQTRPRQFRSGQACDQYNRFKEDFELAKGLNHNAHRLSIEWSRIEPKEGQFNMEAIQHYKSVLATLKEHKMAVMLTLWHFTLPEWVADLGGWENGKTAHFFERFVKKIAPLLGEYVDLWITINEPGVYVYERVQRTICFGQYPQVYQQDTFGAKFCRLFCELKPNSDRF